MTDNFVFLETDWGSLFYYRSAQTEWLDPEEAEQICSESGTHLPIPRWSDENEFYRSYFVEQPDDDNWKEHPWGRGKIWLGVSNSTFEEYIDSNSTTGDWMDWVIDEDSFYHDIYGKLYDGGPHGKFRVAMTPSGQWAADNVNLLHDAVCVLNIPPEACSKCSDPDFCRYKDKTRTEVECF